MIRQLRVIQWTALLSLALVASACANAGGSQSSGSSGAPITLGASLSLTGAPPITVPQALIAESLKVPYLTTNTPVGAFAAGAKGGWKYSWDMFFSEHEQATGIISAVDRFKTNGKIALFTDNEPDGVVERPLYKAAAAAAGRC